MTADLDPIAGPVLRGLLEILGHAGTPLVVVADDSLQSKLVYANAPFGALVGYSTAELHGISPIILVSLEQQAMSLGLLASFRDGRPTPPALEIVLRHRDGHAIPTEFVFSRCNVDDRLFYVVLIRDVNSHLSLLEADRNGLVGALAAGFAHEINNPLTSVLLNLRSLRKQLVANMRPDLQAGMLRCVDDVTLGAERIAGNVRALQTLATRSATGAIDLAAVVASALRLAAPTLEPRAHVIRKLSAVPAVSGEESRIGQAALVMMLFSSSGFDVESASDANQIVVAVEERAGQVVLEVSDNGRDLAPEEMQRAFDPFFRSSVRGAGVGVGLGVARSVAATLGGEVTLAARPGGGAVITMRLPPAPATR